MLPHALLGYDMKHTLYTFTYRPSERFIPLQSMKNTKTLYWKPIRNLPILSEIFHNYVKERIHIFRVNKPSETPGSHKSIYFELMHKCMHDYPHTTMFEQGFCSRICLKSVQMRNKNGKATILCTAHPPVIAPLPIHRPSFIHRSSKVLFKANILQEWISLWL